MQIPVRRIVKPGAGPQPVLLFHAIEGFERLIGKGIFYGAARSEASNTHGLDVQIIGAGNSAGQAAMFFSAHARSVTILYRGETLEKSMSRYLVDQLAGRANIHVRFRTEVTAAHGDTSLEAIDVRDAATGETTRLESGGLFIFIGADAETAWLPPEIALDPKGYVLTGPDVRAAGRWQLDRDPYLLETSVPGIFACGDVRFGPVKRVAAAVGEGSMAIAFVHQYLRDVAARPGPTSKTHSRPSNSALASMRAADRLIAAGGTGVLLGPARCVGSAPFAGVALRRGLGPASGADADLRLAAHEGAEVHDHSFLLDGGVLAGRGQSMARSAPSASAIVSARQ